MLTVSELRKQLEILEQEGLGNCQVWYRDDYNIDYKLNFGLCDNDEKNIVLG